MRVVGLFVRCTLSSRFESGLVLSDLWYIIVIHYHCKDSRAYNKDRSAPVEQMKQSNVSCDLGTRQTVTKALLIMTVVLTWR